MDIHEYSNAITHFARYIIQLTAKKVNELGYEVIYSDSITQDRFVTLLINEKLTIKNIEESDLDSIIVCDTIPLSERS